LLAALPLLAGCGSSSRDAARVKREHAETAPQKRAACPDTVLHTLGQIAKHVYGEGLHSERTRVAEKLIADSRTLREAIERNDPAAVSAAAHSMVASGRLTNLRVLRGASGGEAPGEVLAEAGAGAVAPLRGTIAGAGGATIARYVASVWSYEGIVAETSGIAQSYAVVRSGTQTLAGSFPLPPGRLPVKGSLRVGNKRYRYTSFAAERFPAGKVRIYLVHGAGSFAPLCGATARATQVNTLQSVARLIYAGEIGARAQTQVRRVQSDPALLRAVAARDPEAARLAIDNLLTEHIVRLRVLVEGRLLRDVGGPYVLGPVPGTLRAGGHAIGTFVLSIQDDEGYLRLTRRLGGMDVLMYMGSQLVKNSLGPEPGNPPESGSYTYRGRRFEVFTLNESAFPSGPLRIRVLVPIPYS
jgi:hypothetical protein